MRTITRKNSEEDKKNSKDDNKKLKNQNPTQQIDSINAETSLIINGNCHNCGNKYYKNKPTSTKEEEYEVDDIAAQYFAKTIQSSSVEPQINDDYV